MFVLQNKKHKLKKLNFSILNYNHYNYNINYVICFGFLVNAYNPIGVDSNIMKRGKRVFCTWEEVPYFMKGVVGGKGDSHGTRISPSCGRASLNYLT